MKVNFLPEDYKYYRNLDYPIEGSEIKFDVYQRYLDNFSFCINQSYSGFKELIHSLYVNTKKIKKANKIDTCQIKRFLFIGWNTESLLKLSDNYEDLDLVRINNQWKPIQVYYSIYSLAEAVVCCFGKSAGNHSGCLNQISNFFVSTDLYPWNLGFSGYEGNSKNVSTFKLYNFPKEIIIPNPLSEKIESIQSIACCLRAEHRNRIKEHKKGKKEKYKYLYNPGYTSFFHFIYRLRIKSNYKDAEIFLSEAPFRKIKSFSNNLSYICSYTNIVLEMILIRRLGRDFLVNLMEEFIKSNGLCLEISSREKIYKNLL